MAHTKPTTLWAVVSLVCGALGWLAIGAFLALAERYGEMARSSAGVGAIWGVAHLMLAAAVCLLAVLFGVIALVRTQGGERGGRGQAWTGIVLGGLPWVVAVVLFLLSKADSNPLR